MARRLRAWWERRRRWRPSWRRTPFGHRRGERRAADRGLAHGGDRGQPPGRSGRGRTACGDGVHHLGRRQLHPRLRAVRRTVLRAERLEAVWAGVPRRGMSERRCPDAKSPASCRMPSRASWTLPGRTASWSSSPTAWICRSWRKRSEPPGRGDRGGDLPRPRHRPGGAGAPPPVARRAGPRHGTPAVQSGPHRLRSSRRRNSCDHAFSERSRIGRHRFQVDVGGQRGLVRRADHGEIRQVVGIGLGVQSLRTPAAALVERRADNISRNSPTGASIARADPRSWCDRSRRALPPPDRSAFGASNRCGRWTGRLRQTA